MDAQLVMSKDEIVEKQVKATNIKKARKASGRLPPTSYELKVKSCKKNAQKDLTKVIEMSDTVSKSNHVSSSNFLENQDNKEYEELLLAAEDPDILIDFICCEDNNTEMIELSELYSVSPNDYTLEDQKTDDNEEYKDLSDLLLAADRSLKWRSSLGQKWKIGRDLHFLLSLSKNMVIFVTLDIYYEDINKW